jgi:hypothetical protein
MYRFGWPAWSGRGQSDRQSGEGGIARSRRENFFFFFFFFFTHFC